MANGVQVVSEMPTWDGFLVSVLQVLRSGETVLARDLQDLVADHVELTDAQRAEVIDSGQPRFRNRIGWAVSSLARAGAVERPRRGSYVITEVGRRLLAEQPDRVDEVDLRRIPAYRDHVPTRRSSSLTRPAPASVGDSILDPVEQIDAGISRLRAEVAAQLLERLRGARPDFLEQSVLDVLVAMGYGGVEQRARRIGGSGDGGVDGVIDQDPLTWPASTFRPNATALTTLWVAHRFRASWEASWELCTVNRRARGSSSPPVASPVKRSNTQRR